MQQRTVSHYEIERKIGEGGMGEIYLARDTRLDRPVALKFLPDHLSRDPKARERLLREAKAASKLSHPNILTIHEVGEDEDGNIFIAMAYVEGDTLDQVIARSELSIARVINMATQLCEGLVRAHAAGVVHRDIKPQNILVDRSGRITILDFGLAKVFDAQKLTQTGAMVGTMQYMSPEQARGQEIDHRSDIFSFGAVLYEMITGHAPFAGDNPGTVLNGIMNEQALPPSRINAECPPGLELIVLTALAKKPESRYQKTQEVLDDLRREEKVVSHSLSNPDTLPPMHTKHPRRRLWPYVAPTVLVFAAATAFLIFSPTRFSIVANNEAHAERNTLAVMYFDSVLDPSDVDRTAQMITNLLITDLSESDYLAVVSQQRLFDILKNLGKPNTAVIDRTVASEVAQQAGASWILTGSILQTEPGFILVSSISDAESGRILASQRVEGQPGEAIFSVVDRLGAGIRDDLTLPKAADKEGNRPLTEFTTSSQEAYKCYLEGIDLMEKLDFTGSARLFTRATELDSTFAMAYLRLARAQRSRALFNEANAAAEKAARFVDHATPLERLYIESERAVADGQPDRSIETLREIVKRYPDEKEATRYLADYYLVRRRGAEAAELYEKIVVLDPSSKIAYNNMTYAYEYAGNYDKAIESINRYIALVPDEANPYDSRGDLYAHHGRIDDAIASYQLALRKQADFYPSVTKLGHMHLFRREYAIADSVYRRHFASNAREDHSMGREYLALIPMAQGHLKSALTVIDQGIAADELEKLDPLYIAEKSFLRAEVLATLGRHNGALLEGRKSMDLVKRSGAKLQFYPRAMFIAFLADAGQFVEAKDSLASLETTIRKSDTTRLGVWKYAAARVALAQEDYAKAITLLRNVIVPANEFAEGFELANACLGAGQLGEAASEYKKVLESYDETRAMCMISSVRAHYLLGRAFEQSGWKDEALAQYREFLEYWGSGDPELKEIGDARARIVRLQTAT